MVTLEEKFGWLKEVLEEKPLRFADYYKEDIANYLDIEIMESDEIENLLNKRFDDFIECKSKNDMRNFVSKITGYVVINAQIEEIVADYFS